MSNNPVPEVSLTGDDVYKCSSCSLCLSENVTPLSVLIPCGHSACTDCVRQSLVSRSHWDRSCFTCRGTVTEMTQLRLVKGNNECENCTKLSADPSIPRSFLLPCRHIGCRKCIDKAGNKNGKCPSCNEKAEKSYKLFE